MDMTTTLIEKVLPIVDEAALMTNDHEQGRMPLDEYLVSINNRAEQIIALVRADERKRIREALLSEPTLLAMCSALSLFEPGCDWGEVWDGRFDDPVHADAADEYYRMAQGTAKAAIAAIGLTVEDDQP